MADSICGETEPCCGGKQDSVSIKLTALFYRRLGLIAFKQKFSLSDRTNAVANADTGREGFSNSSV